MWMSTSRLRPDSNVAWEHRCLITVLAMLVGHDQLGVTMVVMSRVTSPGILAMPMN